MTVMITEVYDAFIAAGAPDDKARKAAETLAGFENRFAKIEADLNLVKWMIGANIAMTIATFGAVIRAALT